MANGLAQVLPDGVVAVVVEAAAEDSARAGDLTQRPLVVIAGPTGSGKSGLAVRLAERFRGEVLSCDSVAVYRGMEIGTAKPTRADRARVPHHLIDVRWPDEGCTAGDYSRLARAALAEIAERGRLPIVAGGTGLYLRALVDGLSASPVAVPALRSRLQARGRTSLHRILQRLDPRAAGLIHAHDLPKLVRAVEVALVSRQPLSAQWAEGRAALQGYRVLRLGLAPAREALYERINARAARMFADGLVEETAGLVERYGWECRALRSLGYGQAVAVLRGEMSHDAAVVAAQQGHRHYAKRQGTWFRREKGVVWLGGFGEEVVEEAGRLVGEFVGGAEE